MASERSVTARGIAILPLLLMAMTHFTVTPLKNMFEVEPNLMYGWYGLGLVIGVVLFRKTRTVRDYEYHRSKVMKSMKKVYQAEEDGVWQTNAHLDSNLGPEGEKVLLKQVSAIDKESPELELDEDEKVEVDLLLESERIRKANRRMSGDETFDDELVNSTIGATRKNSPMDSFLDALNRLFGRGDSVERREQKRQASLRAAADASPVIAQRPVAPMRTETPSNKTELKVTSVSDDGEIESVVSESGISVEPQSETAKVYAWDSNSPAEQSTESIESMAMISIPQYETSQPTEVIQSPTGTLCRGCNAAIPQSEPFCLQCGLDA
ncbi:MAG TPA: hypothetical protein QF401_00100 [Candidatus Poseidoniaceae archaeon]|nr:hypothetical protein [Candidatus Poseidoniaceae archaeon]